MIQLIGFGFIGLLEIGWLVTPHSMKGWMELFSIQLLRLLDGEVSESNAGSLASDREVDKTSVAAR